MSCSPNLSEAFFKEDFQNQARHALDNRECIRLLGLRLLQKGLPETEVADLLDVHPQAVYKWLCRYKEGGAESLKDRGGRGRKNILTDEQEQRFKSAVLELQEQREGGRVVGRDIKEMLSKEFGIDCVNSTVYRLLHKVGLSWISGRTCHPESDPEAQEAFKKKFKDEVQQRIPESVDLKNVDVWFQDEGRFGQQNTISRIWAPKGSRPGLIRQRQFKYAYMFGAVCPERDKAIALILPVANTESMALLLNEISKVTPEGQYAAVVIDNAGYHHANNLPEYDNLVLIPLPPYSPELNSSEQLWEWLREHDLSNRSFKNYDAIVDALCDGWKKLTSEVGRLKSLCSRSWATLS